MDNKRILVVGTGLSGIAAVTLLNHKASKIMLQEGNAEAKEEEIKRLLPEDADVEIIIGPFAKERQKEVDLVVLSPGVPVDLDYIVEMREAGIPIWGEIELAYRLSKGRIAAITGTNGKTTTTALVGEIMKSYYSSVFVVGNIGIPYTEIAVETKEDSVIVAEISSFQLETIQEFKPSVSAILNITPDHLNRHHTMENYIDTKLQITKNQDKTDVCVLNYEDEVLREKGKDLSTNVFYFSSKRPLEQGIYLDQQGNIIYRNHDLETCILNVCELNLLGKHNYENVMAAIAIATHMGVPMECIKKAACEFVAVEHRMEYVAEKKGVKYYNDSKGTNPDAAIKAIEAMVSPTILIGGGYDKNSEYEEWIQSFHGNVRYLVLFGQTRDKIAAAAKRCGFFNIILVEDLKEAVEVCAENAEPGNAVLLSPACASWGMFKNYEERGRMFKEYVNAMK